MKRILKSKILLSIAVFTAILAIIAPVAMHKFLPPKMIHSNSDHFVYNTYDELFSNADLVCGRRGDKRLLRIYTLFKISK